MIKGFSFGLLVSIFFIQFSFAVKTPDFNSDQEAIAEGRKASSVCQIHVFFGEGENMLSARGSGTLVESDIIATAAHIVWINGDLRYKEYVKKFMPGIPIKVSGFVTFAANAKKILSDYEKDPRPELLASFYEIDSLIIDPSFPIQNKSVSPRFDRAFIKLKRPAADIDPTPFYTPGTIPETKLQLHEVKSLCNDKKSIKSLLIDAYAYGYGSDIKQEYGLRRGIYQPCFIGCWRDKDESDDESDSSDDHRSSSSVNSTESESDSDKSDDESEGMEWEDAQEINEGESVPITGYFPGHRESLKTTLEIGKETHYFCLDGSTNKFNNSLAEIIKKKGKILGVIDEGDSGGPLISSGKLIGVVSQGNNLGELLVRNVKDFADMTRVYQVYESYYTPLFSYKTGKILPVVEKMTADLKNFPVSTDSKLEELLLWARKTREMHIQEIDSVILDLQSRIEKGLNIEDCKKMIKEYQGMIPLFVEGKDFLRKGDVISFTSFIHEKIIPKLEAYIANLRGS